jgi:hypothetical protein
MNAHIVQPANIGHDIDHELGVGFVRVKVHHIA